MLKKINKIRILKKFIKVIIILIVLVLLYFISWYLYVKIHTVDDEIWIFPHNAKGFYVVMLNDEKGRKQKYNEKNQIIYEFKNNDTIFIKTNKFMTSQEYLYVDYFINDSLKGLTEIIQIYGDTSNVKKPFVIGYGTGVGHKYLKNDTITYQILKKQVIND